MITLAPASGRVRSVGRATDAAVVRNVLVGQRHVGESERTRISALEVAQGVDGLHKPLASVVGNAWWDLTDGARARREMAQAPSQVMLSVWSQARLRPTRAVRRTGPG